MRNIKGLLIKTKENKDLLNLKLINNESLKNIQVIEVHLDYICAFPRVSNIPGCRFGRMIIVAIDSIATIRYTNDFGGCQF